MKFSKIRKIKYQKAIAVTLAIFLITQFILPIQTQAATKSWNFSTSSDYTFDNTKIEFSSGQVQLKATSTPAWYSTSWTKRKAITVTGSSAGAQTNYQLKITVPYVSGMQTNFNDIRFTSSEGTTLIDYWLESKTDSSTADFWVEIPNIPASPDTVLIYMYYGNASVGSVSNGINTFDYFGDYEQSNLALRFITASDGHYGEAITDYTTNFQNIVTWLNSEKTTNGLDYAFFLGDNVMDDPTLLSTVKGYYDQLTTPYRVIEGNHDRITSDQWLSTWGYAENYDFESGDYAFIFADTSDVSGTYLCADSTWLNSRLDYYASKKYVFIFMHITPNTWTTYGVDCPTVRSVIGSHHNVAAVYQGHDHQFDGTKFRSNTNYAWDGRFGGSFGVNYKGYRVTNVYNDGSIYTYQYNPTTSSIVNSNRFEFSQGYPLMTEVISNSTDIAQNGSQSLKLSGADQSYGVFIKKPISAGKYVLESWVSSTTAGTVQAIGVGLVNTTAADPKAVTGNYIQNFLYYSTNKVYTDIATDSVRDRAFYDYTLAGDTWYKSKIILDGTNASFYSPSGSLLRTASYDPAKVFPAFPFFRHDGPAVGYFDLYIIRKYANSEPTYNIESETTFYDTNNPSVSAKLSTAQTFNSLSGFSETATKNGGQIKYQLSNDSGTTWYWYNSGWTATSSEYTEANTASDINTNISTFPVGSGSSLFKAYLHSDGSQLVQLDNIDLTYITDITGPTGTIGNGNGSPTNDTTPTFNLTIADEGIGITNAQMQFSCDNSTWSTWESYATPKTDFNIRTGAGCTDADGSKTVYVGYKDSLGNIGSSYNTGAFILDTTSSIATLSNTPTSLTTSTSASITIAGTDITDYKYKLDSGSYGSETAVATTLSLSSLADGSHTLSVIGKDSAGNWQAEGSATTYTWTVDTTASVVTFSIPTTSDSLTITFTSFSATDANGVTGYLVNESATTPSLSDTGWSSSAQTQYIFTTEGAKTLYAWAKDEAENISTSGSGAVTVTLPTPAVSRSSGSVVCYNCYANFAIPSKISTNGGTSTTLNKNVFPGFQNSQVKVLQQFLNQNGYKLADSSWGSPGNETDYFGLLTSRALAKFQEANKDKAAGMINEKGFLGPITRQFINSSANVATPIQQTQISAIFTTPLYRRLQSENVRRLQILLAIKPEIYPEGLITGYFGPLTEKAVQTFQLKYEVVDSKFDPGFGYVGPKTRLKLNEVFGN